MPVRDYAVAIACVMAVGVPTALAAVRWRRRIVPDWSGLQAHLATIVIAFAGLFATLQLLGTIGAFRRWPVVATCAAAGLLAAVAARPTELRRGSDSASPPDRRRTLAALVPIGMGSFVLALWSLGTFVAMNAGPVESDTQIYHLPQSVEFIQEGWLTRLHFMVPDTPIPYHPSNGELLHALGILTTGNDVASAFLNLGWAALVLGAAWAVGHRWGHGAQSACAAAVLLMTPVMVSTQSGSAMTDTMGLFFFLAAVALFASRSPAGNALGGLAAGLAISTKLTFVAPVGLLTVAVLALAVRDKRRPLRTAVEWCMPLVLTGGFWYARNAIRVGNPVPTLQIGIGSWSLPKVPTDLVDRFGFSVADYATDLGVWRRSFGPGLRDAFGVIGSIVALITFALLVVIVVRQRDLLVRLLAAVALVAAVGYAFTPTTALGTAGHPTLFTTNLRYLAPALMLGLVLSPVFFRQGRRATLVLLAVPVIALAVYRVPEWPPETRLHVWKGVGVFVISAAAAGILVLTRQQKRARMAGAAVAAIAVSIVGGYLAQQRFIARRYSPAGTYAANGGWDTAPFLWAHDIRNSHIGLAGFFGRYPFYGPDLSNTVDYVGMLSKNHEFTDYRSCPTWRRAVNSGRYDYIVIMPPFEDRPDPPQLEWTRTSPAVELVLSAKRGHVFRVRGSLSPDQCGG